MEVKEVVGIAKQYIISLFEDETVTNLGLEETEYDETTGNWNITVGFSRPWNTARSPRTEVLEQLGAAPSLRRSYKVITVADNGTVLAMKNRARAEVAD